MGRSVSIVVLGASGLIGHKLVLKLRERFDDVHALLHRSGGSVPGAILLEPYTDSVDVKQFDQVVGALRALGATTVLNCAGITKRKPAINDLQQAIEVNALFPHRLAQWAGESGVRVIHFSTDCVFDGTSGPYADDAVTTPLDTYGRTKALGEIRYDHSLTIRSSFIGRELYDGTELLDWFLAQAGGSIRGFSKAFYSGVSTTVMSRVVGDIIEHHPELNGLYQLSAEQPISKYDLLVAAREAFAVDVEIADDPSFETRPTLDGSRLRAAMSIDIPSWPDMLAQLASESYYEEN